MCACVGKVPYGLTRPPPVLEKYLGPHLVDRYVEVTSLLPFPCSVDDRLHVKLADSALSRDLFPDDYHCLGDGENRPVKWLALESLLLGEFSTASDLWMYGVALWELMTLGQQPYIELDPFEVAAHLSRGYRLGQPVNCPDPLYVPAQASFDANPAIITTFSS